MISRLRILMENFSISGKDLSALLHVDSSLVSKWRSGTRSLKPNSVYTSQIIKHVMALDRNNQYAKLRMMLSNEYVNIFKCSENEIAIFLKDWLTSTNELTENARDYFDEIKDLKNTSLLNIYSLSGINGRQQATLFFLKYAQHLSPGVELWLYSTENLKMLNENKAFLDERYMRYMSILGENNRIRIIHALSGSYEGLARAMLSWMPMHMTGRTTAYFVPKYKDEQLAYTYYLVKDHLALYNWSSMQAGREINTYLTHEPQLVKDVEVMLESHFAESTRVFDKFTYSMRDEFLNDMVAVAERDYNEYHWCSSIPVHAIADGRLREIFLQNSITGDELEQRMEAVLLIKELGRKTQHCYFIAPDGMRRMTAHQEEVTINDLSFICGQEIKVSSEFFVTLLREAAEINAAADNVKLCMASTSLLDKLSGTEVVAKENTRVSFSRTIDSASVLVTTEMTVVTALYSYFEELWNMTPYICRNKEYVIKRMHRVLNELESDKAKHNESDYNIIKPEE